MGTVHLFSQVASLIGRTLVNFAAKKRHTDKYCQTLDTWTHLISLLFCHMADCQSLRDICKGLQGIRGGLNHLGIQKAPSRNALSHQNAKRDAMVFRDIYRLLHKRLDRRPSSVGSGRLSKHPVSCCLIRVLLHSASIYSIGRTIVRKKVQSSFILSFL